MIDPEHWLLKTFRREIAHHADVATDALPVLLQLAVCLDVVFVILAEVTTIEHFRQ